MYNLLIVDDEDIIRRGMERALQRVGDFRVLAAENGEQAVACVAELTVDAVILDISMPGMDGVEVMKWMQERGFHPLVLVLSGYDDFEYAQEALKYGAMDYILKPVDSDDVITIGGRIKALLDEKTAREHEYRMLREEVQLNKRMIKERFFRDVVRTKPDMVEFARKTQFLGIRVNGSRCRVAVMELEQDVCDPGPIVEEDRQVRLQLLENTLERMAVQSGLFDSFHVFDDSFVLLYSWEDGPQGHSEPDVHAAVESMKLEIDRLLGASVTVGIGDVCGSPEGIPRSYRQAVQALGRKLLLGNGHIYTYRDFRENDAVLGLDEYVDSFKEALFGLQPDKACQVVADALRYLESRKTGLNALSVPFFAMRCLGFLVSAVHKYGLETARIFDDAGNPYTALIAMTSMESVREWLSASSARIIAAVRESNVYESRNIAAQVRNYIDEMHAEPITVASLGQRFGFSPNYLGHLFKEEIGQSINEYVNAVRIEQAKKMLRDTDKLVYEIAERVGYQDQHYFSQVFKKTADCSPKEYRERTRGS